MQRLILVVEDEKPILDILQFNLEKEGYKVVTAMDGETAVSTAFQVNPDLILLTGDNILGNHLCDARIGTRLAIKDKAGVFLKKLTITGGIPLSGEVTIRGSKNAAVGILPAVLLVHAPVTIENVPNVADIRIILEIMRSLGATCEQNGDVVKIDPTGVKTFIADNDRINRLRGSYYFIGALLGRFGHAEVVLPGGCNFCLRPIDQHLKGFSALGANIVEEYGMVKAHSLHGLVGTHIYMDVVSVGATINIMLAACKAEGQTVIENCAKEPHVVDVANFLNSMGANIKGAGTNVIRIKGVK